MRNSPSKPIDNLNKSIPLSQRNSGGGQGYQSLKDDENRCPQQPDLASNLSEETAPPLRLCFVFFSVEEAEKFRKKITSCLDDDKTELCIKMVNGVKLSFLLLQPKEDALNHQAERIDLSVNLKSEIIKRKLQLRESKNVSHEFDKNLDSLEFDTEEEDENQFYPPYEFMYSSPGMKLY